MTDKSGKSWVESMHYPSGLAEAFEYSMFNPSMRAIGFELNLEQFIAHKDRFTFVTFDPTDQSTPPPLRASSSCILSLSVSPYAQLALPFSYASSRGNEKNDNTPTTNIDGQIAPSCTGLSPMSAVSISKRSALS